MQNQDWQGADSPGPGAGDVDRKDQGGQETDTGADADTFVNPAGQTGRKGGEAGNQGFNSADTSDYGTDSSVDTQDVIGVGSANEDFDEAGGDATDNITESSDEEDE